MPDETKADAAAEAPETKDTPTPAESPMDAADRALDEALAASEPKEDTGPNRGPDGKFAPKQDDEPGEQEPAAEADDNDTTPQPADTSKYSDDDLRTALKALQRDAAPKSVLDAATKGDADTIAYALKRAKVQADTDKAYDEKKAIADELASLKRSGPKDTATTGDSPKADQPTDVDALVQPLAKQLEEVTGEDLSEHIRTSFAGLLDRVKEAHQGDLKQRDEQVAKLNAQFAELDISRARDALISEYPQLKSQDTWAKVRAELDSLPESESRPDTLTRLDHAARIVLAPEIAKQSAEARTRRNATRDNGTPSTSTRKDSPKQMSSRDLSDALLDAQMEGDEKRAAEIRAELNKHRS